VCSKISFFALSPEEIQPIPQSNKTTARISRTRGKTAILTESPYKNELLAANILSTTPRQVKRSLSFVQKKKKLKQPTKILVRKLKPTKKMNSVCIVMRLTRLQWMGGFSMYSVKNGLIVFVLEPKKKIMRQYLSVIFVPKIVFKLYCIQKVAICISFL